MATLNLGSFSATTTSVLGYDSVKSSYAFYPSTSITGSVTSVTSVTGGALDLTQATAASNRTDLTSVEFGSSSDDWSILGSSVLSSVEVGTGNDSVLIAAPASDVKVNSGNGDDYVSLGAVSGNVTVNGAAGADSVYVGSATNAEIDLGDGADYASIGSVTGSATVKGGAGADSVVITNAGTDVNVELGEGKDFVTVGAVDRNVNITASGSDANFVSLNSASGTATIELAEGADTVTIGSVSGGLTVTSGAGNDSIVIDSIKEEKAGSINVGDGNDFVSINSASGELNVALGAGKDSVTIDAVAGALTLSASGTDANNVSINSASQVAITLGDGADSLDIVSVVSGTIALGAGKDSVNLGGLNAATVTSGADDKHISLGSASAASVTLGDGADVVSLGGNVEASTLDLGDGKDTLDGTATSITSSTITAGAGNDSLVLDSVQSSSIDLGAGDDVISLHGASDVTVAGGAGSDVFVLDSLAGNVTISDYDIASDVVSITGGTPTDAMLQSDGKVSVAASQEITLNTTGDYYAARFGSALKGSSIVAWAAENGSTIDASSLTETAIIYGTTNSDVVDTLIGGSKADSIYAGAGDVVYGGAGNDVISLAGASSVAGARVGLSASGGTDTVTNFESVSSSAAGDSIYLFENSIADLTFTNSGTNTTAKVGKGELVLNGVDSSTMATVNVVDNTGASNTVAVVGGTASVTDVTEMANIYYGTNTSSALDFTKVDDSLVVDLGNTGAFTNSGNAVYAGKFSTVKGGSDTTVLLGTASGKETLMAGTGNTTLWGGGSAADMLDGQNGQSATDTNVTYFYTAGDGKDTIQNGKWGSADGDDVLYLSNVAISSIKNDGTNTVIKTSNSTDKLTILGYGSSNSDTALKFTTDGTTISKVKIGVSTGSNSWTYDEEVAAYMGGSNNTLKVGSDVDTANIWLDGSAGVSYEGVKNVDATSSSGTLIIAGSGSVNETLTAGRGETSLWGGSGSSNDTLKSSSSSGSTTFFFGKGDGSDVITSSYSDDKVFLYNVALSDIASLDDSTSGKMVFTLNDGSSLTINSMSSSSVKTFTLGDGSSWEYNYSSKTWSQA